MILPGSSPPSSAVIDSTAQVASQDGTRCEVSIEFAESDDSVGSLYSTVFGRTDPKSVNSRLAPSFSQPVRVTNPASRTARQALTGPANEDQKMRSVESVGW